MAILTNIERLNYYEGEYLGAADFDAEQQYHRDMRRRHNIGQHTMGIVAGLDLAQVPNGGPNGQVDVYLMPGMAVDGFGREIVVLGKAQLTQEPFAPYYDPNVNAAPKQMYLWIAYGQSLVQGSQDVCTSAGTTNAFGRVEESYRIAVTPDPTSPVNDPIVVDGADMTPGPLATPPSPGDIVVPADGSVPYQEFPTDDQTVNWFIPIGRVLWDPHNEVFVGQPDAASAQGRLYAGSVTETIYAPGGALRVLNRNAPDPLPSDPNDPQFAGATVEVAGSLHVDRGLQVDGVLNAVTDALIGALYDPTNKTPLSPLTISADGLNEELIQFRTSAGRETWHICENLNGVQPGLNIGEFVNGAPVEGRLFIQSTIQGASVPSTVNVGVGTMTPRGALGIRGQGAGEELLSFEDGSGTTRWHVNQVPKSPGGPLPRGLNFCETNVAEGRLFLQTGGNVGVGTALPQQNLSVNGSLNIDQANVNPGLVNPGLTFGSTSGEGIASKRTAGANQYGLDFYTAFAPRVSITNDGKVGLGLTAPDNQLHLSGGAWDLTNTEGDLKIGNTAMRLKMGVALGGAGAGDARIRASGGTSRLMIGSGADDTLTIQGQNVGINSINPAFALDVTGTTMLRGSLSVQSNVGVDGNVSIAGNLIVFGSKSGYVTDRFIYRGKDPLERGDVVVLHPHPSSASAPKGRIPLIEIELTEKAGDSCVCGIVDEISLAPEQLSDMDIKRSAGTTFGLMVTLGAYAYCKVDATEEAIKAGDLLVTSKNKGYAARIAKLETKPGAIVGKALGAVGKGKTGVIPVFVSHH
jgi:hypothetical protein